MPAPETTTPLPAKRMALRDLISSAAANQRAHLIFQAGVFFGIMVSCTKPLGWLAFGSGFLACLWGLSRPPHQETDDVR